MSRPIISSWSIIELVAAAAVLAGLGFAVYLAYGLLTH
jgi:hypothetical protein